MGSMGCYEVFVFAVTGRTMYGVLSKRWSDMQSLENGSDNGETGGELGGNLLSRVDIRAQVRFTDTQCVAEPAMGRHCLAER